MASSTKNQSIIRSFKTFKREINKMYNHIKIIKPMEKNYKKNRKMAAYRKYKGLRQSDLAKQVGCSLCTIVFIESGKTIPKVDVAKKIAAALGCKVEDLF